MDQVVGTGSEKLEGIRENREGIGMADKLAGFKCADPLYSKESGANT